MITYSSFSKSLEFFQTRLISAELLSQYNGYCLLVKYQCNDGKRTVSVSSYSQEFLICLSFYLKGFDTYYSAFTYAQKKCLLTSFSLFPRYAERVIKLD